MAPAIADSKPDVFDVETHFMFDAGQLKFYVGHHFPPSVQTEVAHDQSRQIRASQQGSGIRGQGGPVVSCPGARLAESPAAATLRLGPRRGLGGCTAAPSRSITVASAGAPRASFRAWC